MPDIFEPRTQLKPYEYPQLSEYKDAIHQSFWVSDEFSYDADVQDFRVGTTETERSVIEKTMLAISQIEVDVKTFWGDLHRTLPKPEIAMVGATFSDSETRHADAYSELLDLLGLQSAFDRIHEIPAIIDRVNYLRDYRKGVETKRDFALEILLFSIFVEHVSLFSQFLIMTAFDRKTNRFKGISNAVESTSAEEDLHGLFGVELIRIIREENPEWFDEAMTRRVKRGCRKAYEAEEKVLNWIFSEGELDFLPRAQVSEFLKGRFNDSLERVEVQPIFDTDPELLKKTRWFEEDRRMTKDNDFFNKRGTAYSKGTQAVTADDLF